VIRNRGWQRVGDSAEEKARRAIPVAEQLEGNPECLSHLRKGEEACQSSQPESEIEPGHSCLREAEPRVCQPGLPSLSSRVEGS